MFFRCTLFFACALLVNLPLWLFKRMNPPQDIYAPTWEPAVLKELPRQETVEVPCDEEPIEFPAPVRPFKPLTREKLQQGGPWVALRILLCHAESFESDLLNLSGTPVKYDGDGWRIVRYRVISQLQALYKSDEIKAQCGFQAAQALAMFDDLLADETVEKFISPDGGGPDDFFCCPFSSIAELSRIIYYIYEEACRQ